MMALQVQQDRRVLQVLDNKVQLDLKVQLVYQVKMAVVPATLTMWQIRQPRLVILVQVNCCGTMQYKLMLVNSTSAISMLMVLTSMYFYTCSKKTTQFLFRIPTTVPTINAGL